LLLYGDEFMKKNRLICACALLACAAALGAGAFGQEKAEAGAAHKIVRAGDLKWAPIIKGCELALVSGDPAADGAAFVLRIRCVDGAKIPAHWHPTDENVTVLKGMFLVGMGEKFDETKFITMNAGNFVSMPKKYGTSLRVRAKRLCKSTALAPSR
jgi:hypothetical protein